MTSVAAPVGAPRSDRPVGEAEFVVPKPRRKDRGDFYVAPILYPRMLRQVADLIDALTALESPDPSNKESAHFVAHAELPIYDEESTKDDDSYAGLEGWVCQYGAGCCWVFVPYVPEIEASR